MPTPTNGIVWVFNEESLRGALDDYLAGEPDAAEQKAVILDFLHSEVAERHGVRRMALKPVS